MPSHLRNSSRAYSFPPWIDMAEHEASQASGLPDIDEDPFAHFISPITEADDPYELSLSAGIVHDGPQTSKAAKFKSNVANKWARYVQHNHNNLHSQYHTPTIQEEDDEEETFMGLDDDRLNDTPHIVSQLSPPRITSSESMRGRGQDLVARKTQNRRRYSRTLSGHRHSWREPSPDLFTVDESEEEEAPVLRRPRARKPKDATATFQSKISNFLIQHEFPSIANTLLHNRKLYHSRLLSNRDANPHSKARYRRIQLQAMHRDLTPHPPRRFFGESLYSYRKVKQLAALTARYTENIPPQSKRTPDSTSPSGKLQMRRANPQLFRARPTLPLQSFCVPSLSYEYAMLR
ncbi:predicted protein [Plenodomus lingam JN3]|uniref:Predicted protein n=1 Tax=Leptosphaeria maculans (strain JN3 / isolate v23.1.3 / race Av1-4-5-6-7-8) TaxID=985895 RepID=E5ACD6_LEPMJ|nr:predicted protein [Plenodomus lingam JN3]CBY02138.1 predicted protein [Plenodomus lingam JN3]